MRNYFSKILVVFFISITVYFSTFFIKDKAALTALITPLALLCLIMYAYFNSNINQFGRE